MADQNCLNNEDELVSELSGDNQIDSNIEMENQIETKMENVVEIFSVYDGSETDDIKVNVDNTNNIISATLKQQWFNSTDEFPAVGSKNLIYVDKSTKAIYTWNSETVAYDRIVQDWTQIESINGGNA